MNDKVRRKFLSKKFSPNPFFGAISSNPKNSIDELTPTMNEQNHRFFFHELIANSIFYK